MSYSLYFRNEGEQLTAQQFLAYFTGRKNYTLDGKAACYMNEDTGVHYMFEYMEIDPDEQATGEEYFPVEFMLNYCRSACFASEAEPEVRSFVEHFSLLVADPQAKGMQAGKYDPEEFIAEWSNGNAGSYSAAAGTQQGLLTLPGAVLAAVRDWNQHRVELQDSILEDIYVPRISLFRYEDEVKTAVTWSDGIPTLIPKVDLLLLHRKEFAPRKLFKQVEDFALASWADFAPLLERHKLKLVNGAFYLYYVGVPPDIKRAICDLPPREEGTLERVSIEQVLDRELMEPYMQKQREIHAG